MADEPDAFRKGLSIAMRIGVELVASLIVGGGLGYRIISRRAYGQPVW